MGFALTKLEDGSVAIAVDPGTVLTPAEVESLIVALMDSELQQVGFALARFVANGRDHLKDAALALKKVGVDLVAIATGGQHSLPEPAAVAPEEAPASPEAQTQAEPAPVQEAAAADGAQESPPAAP